MGVFGSTYLADDTPVHRTDARVKIALLLAFSIAIFFVRTWWGMGVFTVVVVALVVAGRIPAKRLIAPLVPVIVLAAFSAVYAFAASPNMQGLSSGLFTALRMIVLVAASFVVCFTTTSTALVKAFAWFISPLRALRVPVDDIALTLSLAIRFIPVIVEELHRIRAAQIARGAALDGLSFTRKLRIWAAAFSSLFVGLFRHAAALAHAMDARCYGMRQDVSNTPRR